MEKLTTSYRKYAREALRSGAAGVLELIPDEDEREIMDLMHELEQHNVTTNPKKTLSAGAETSKHLSNVVRRSHLLE